MPGESFWGKRMRSQCGLPQGTWIPGHLSYAGHSGYPVPMGAGQRLDPLEELSVGAPTLAGVFLPSINM